MAKLEPADLEKIRKRMARTMSLRDGEATARVIVHMGTCGIAAGARKIMSALLAARESTEREDVMLSTSSCAGLCSREPMMTVVLRDGAPVKYVDLDEQKAATIFDEHVLGGKIVEEYALAVGHEHLG